MYKNNVLFVLFLHVGYHDSTDKILLIIFVRTGPFKIFFVLMKNFYYYWIFSVFGNHQINFIHLKLQVNLANFNKYYKKTITF